MSLRDQYLGAAKPRRKSVPCPDLAGPDGAVTVRELTGLERDEFQGRQLQPTPDGKSMRVVPRLDNAQLVCWALIDPETGARVFADADYATVADLPGRVLEPLAAAVLELSGLTGAEKNSETTPAS